MAGVREFHAARWHEPLVHQLGAPGRRGQLFERHDEAVASLGLPPELLRQQPPDLPELSEHEVLQHYLRLSQETLGMMGISLFGTCTMKYNPRLGDRIVNQPGVRDLHPRQDPRTMQGALRVIHELDLMLRELSGMDAFVFEAGGGADAAYLHTCVTRAYHLARGELGRRDEIITSAQAHPCNPATAAAAGFKVVTIGLGDDGLPSLEALRSVVSDRTAALMINNPDDMGLYNPSLPEWVRTVHEAGGLAFYDHANFNGVMTRLRARELGFDACMFMLHKTYGGTKGGGGPAVGAYGCTQELAEHLASPRVVAGDDGYSLVTGDGTAGRVREFLGNLPVVVRAYAWLLANGSEGLRTAADLSVLANNYMETRLLEIRGVEKSFASAPGHRLEMTRYSLARLTDETGVTAVDVQNRMTDFGIDAFWLSHEPWIVPEPFTPEAGETWPKEDIDRWIDVLAHVVDEAYRDPELVRGAPYNQPIGRVDASTADDPATWATTWRALRRKWPEGLDADGIS